MSRDGGFALVASATQGLANQLLSAFAAGLAPQSLSVPPINVGGTMVTVTGSVALLPPTVTFRNRSDGLITTGLSVGGLLSLTTSTQSAQLVDVVFSASLDVPLTTPVTNNQITASVDLSQVTVNQLAVQFLSAPPLPIFQNAVTSPSMAAAITSFLRLLPALPVTVPLMSASVTKLVSRGVPPGQDPSYGYNNRSTFPPYPNRFGVQLSVNRVVLRQFDGAITVAADLAGITNGEPSQLVDLTSTWSPLVSLVEEESYDGTLSSGSAGPGVPGTHAVVLTSAAVISSVLANQVSPHLDAGPLIDDHVLVHSISADLGWFDAGAPFGTGYGLTINLDTSYYANTSEDALGYFWPANALHSPANVKIYVRVLGVDPFRNPASWRFEVVNTDISLPGWLALPLVSLSVGVFCLAPVLIGLEAALAGAFAAFTDALIQTADQTVTVAGNAALGAASVPTLQTVTIPGTTIDTTIDLWNYGISSEGPETWLKVSAKNSAADAQGIGLQLNGDQLPRGASTASVYFSTPNLDLAVVVPPKFPDPTSVFIEWSVSRKDTGATVASRANRLSDPGGNTFTVSRVSGGLQGVNGFALNVTLFLPGQIIGYSVDVAVVDWLDRSRRFVQWTSHTWFRDPSKPKEWIYYWERTRPSRIHRTEWPGRCRRLSPPPWILQGVLDREWPTPLAANPVWAQYRPEDWTYLDALPFTSAEEAVAKRRGILCDYCFFGGPTKKTLLVPVP